MRRHKLLLAITAIATTGALAFAPAARASNPTGGSIADVLVGGVSANPALPVDAILKSGGSYTVAVYGVPSTIGCSAGSGSGTVDATLPGFRLGLSLVCSGLFGGSTLVITSLCDINFIMADGNVHAGLVDTGSGSKFSVVDGTAHVTNGSLTYCLRVEVSNGCTFRIGGNIAATFDEAMKTVAGVSYQDLRLSGSGLQIKNPTASCLGAVSNGQAIAFNVVFNTRANAGTVDFIN